MYKEDILLLVEKFLNEHELWYNFIEFLEEEGYSEHNFFTTFDE